MSGEPASASSSPLKNLRHFRFQKTVLPSLGSERSRTDLNGSTSSDIAGFVRRGGRNVIVDSEDEKTPTKCPDGLRGLIAMFPHVNPQVIEKYLIESQGDYFKAKAALRADFPGVCEGPKPIRIENLIVINKPYTLAPSPAPTAKRKFSSEANDSNGSKPKIKKFKKIKRVRDDSDECSGSDSGDDGFSKEDNRVFDSDEDSDFEVSNETTYDQEKVLDFLSTATLGELLCMPHISRKKADAIVELRPFAGWSDMVEKFQQMKGLGGEILNSAQDFLYTRRVIHQLMEKCSKLSTELDRLNSAGLNAVSTQPILLNSEYNLAGYQLVGLNWLVMLHRKGLNGILADEMGLGKTVQIIAFLAWLKENPNDNVEPNLIVVPASTLDNWSNELKRWCPTLKVLTYYGDKEERRVMRSSTMWGGGINQYDAVLTTYSLLTTSPEERKMFRVLKLQYVIFDEAHMLKNMKTSRYEQLSQVNARRRILLTGTPLQNSLLELMSLLTFVMPDMFKNKKSYLKCLFTRNSTKDKGDNPEPRPEELPRFEREQVAQAKKIMKPFVLRRLKKDVLKDLPLKTDLIKYCDMSPRQRAVYDSLISTYSKSAAEEKTGDEMSGMTMMMQLRKVANHPLLVRQLYLNDQIPRLAELLVKEPDYKEKNLDYVKEDLAILSDFELHCLCKFYPSLLPFALDEKYILDSGKFLLLDEMLPAMQKEGHRLLIFSQFVIMLNILEHYMNIRGYKFLRLDGNTPVPVRQEMIDEFNRDPSITAFLLSTRAGGLGINLTAADTVIIHDLDFNPYNDKQAEDRCHRVGQTKPVSVYRIVTKASIEIDICQIATEKLHLEKEISAEDRDVEKTKQLLKKALGLDQGVLPVKTS